MTYDIGELEGIIIEGVQSLTKTHTFQDWLNEQNASEGDIVVINNSFVYRQDVARTSKNRQFLCVKLKGKKLDLTDVLVTEAGEQNLDFKLFNAKSKNLPSLQPLEEALKTELENLGQLIFVLIGELQDIPEAVELGHGTVKELRFEPSARESGVVEQVTSGDWAIVVNQLIDPGGAWKAAESQLLAAIGDDLSSLQKKFMSAFRKLQENTRLKLLLPTPGSIDARRSSFLERLYDSVAQQRIQYREALDKYSSSGATDDLHLREIMRISYNFADDALSILELLVSIADLKGVLLWCTIKEHFDVAEAFRNLPWTRSNEKPSLKEYKTIISGARNRAFHNLFAFDRTIEADLVGIQVNARRLTLLPAYTRTRRGADLFDYEDREIVEILTKLTRAPETAVPIDFWQKNDVVMESFEKLLKKTVNVLWALNCARAQHTV